MTKSNQRTAKAAILTLLIATTLVLGACKPSAVNRAASKAAATKALKPTGTQSAARASADVTLRRWTAARCSTPHSCPLPQRHAETFVGGSYNEVRLGQDTTLYRVYTSSERKFGVPGERYSFWSRSTARGRQALIDSAVPTSTNGNTAAYQVAIQVPRGTVIYEGRARGLARGPAGGGNQVVLERAHTDWAIR